MTGPLFQFWRYGTLTCRMSLTTASAPYWVLTDGDAQIQLRSFTTHDEATRYAIEELRRVTNPRAREN
jgi:hypothetical protein